MDLERAVSLQGMLGYLNFAGGKPDARFEKQVNDAYAFFAERGSDAPWAALHAALAKKLAELKAAGGSAFRDTAQVEAVLELVFARVLPAYRQHHADLLFHRPDAELFVPFFLARVFEAVLAQGGPWDEDKRIVGGALQQLNDYVGYRPIAVLETRPRGEPYAHERVRPLPLYIKGTGVAWGQYHDLVTRALDILSHADPGVLAEAGFDPNLLDELALDPRAYDHGHPANRRPNYVFGEWDPHQIDNQGRYRRYIVRGVTIDALLERVATAGPPNRDEALFEAAAVLAGTILMAAGTSGPGPTAYDSSVTLATLMPRIARYRDTFYAHLLETVPGAHGERLRDEAATTRQPFGGARQHLNHYLARHRAAQLQQKQLALLFAEMGYPDASREAAAGIPAASVRLLSEILGRLTTGQLLSGRGSYRDAARLPAEAEALLDRGIACGAFVDPWNVLGFQGLFPLSPAREDSIRDPRVDELVYLVEQTFRLYSRLASEAAAAGDAAQTEALLAGLRRRAAWWDRFATSEVGDVRRVRGAEVVASAEHVTTALARWHERGETTADLGFWREHLAGFQSPKAFAVVVEALLRKDDYRAAMALLMNWLGHAGQVPLEDADHSFHTLAVRWMLGYTTAGRDADPWPLVGKFFDYLEANAEDFWQVPSLHAGGEELPMPRPAEEDEEDEDVYGAAYDDVTYKDSADDKQEGAVLEGGEELGTFDLEHEGERLGGGLRFLSTVARLWQIAARLTGHGRPERREALVGWLGTARDRRRELLSLLDALHEHPVPEPLGSYDSLVEYDRRRLLKEQLVYTAVGTCLDATMAVGALEGAVDDLAPAPGRPAWEPAAIRLEQALLRGDPAGVRQLLPEFLAPFQREPLLFTALADGGNPRQMLRVRTAQAVLRALVASLPRLGLLHETYELLRTARTMEQAHPPQRRGVTEFNHLFQAGYQAVVEAVVDSEAARNLTPARNQELVDLLERLTRPFLAIWVEHSQTLQLSTLETLRSEEEWERLRGFIRRYGADLFHARFLTLGNLRGILHRGVGAYLDYLRDNPDPLHPVKLLDDLEAGTYARPEAERWLQVVLQALVENYEEYKDYNTTTPQSDYGENLHLLLDFLRLKAGYERHTWRLRPLVLAHEVLARRGRADFAVAWEEAFTRLTQDLAGQYAAALAGLEQRHGVRLRTVADRIHERFVKTLALDRLCALIEPAMAEARSPAGGRAFVHLQRELTPLAETPTGVGLDVPHWLRRLEAEVQRVRAAQAPTAALAESFARVPARALTLDELQEELRHWEA